MGATAAAEGEALTYQQALETIRDARGYEEPLRRRTEGVTWMVWGIVLVGMNFHYGLVYALGVPDTGIWVPWLLVAIGLSVAVRRIASVTSSAVRIGWRSGLAAMAGLVALLGGLFVALNAVGLNPETHPLVGYTVLGGLWVVFAAWNPHRATPLGRKVMVAIGVTGAALGAVYASFVPVLTPDMWAESAFAANLIGGVPPIVAGFWQAMRG